MSVFNSEFNCIFIAIPKAASGSMAHIFGKTGHKDITYFRKFFLYYSVGLTYDNSFKFGFVRNPWDRFVSCYLQIEPNGTKETMTRYVDNIVNNYVNNKHDSIPEILLRPQWRFLCNSDQDISVDFVGRFENLEEDWKEVCGILDINNKLPHLNKTKRDHWRKYYTVQSKNRIKSFYKIDFELFYPTLI